MLRSYVQQLLASGPVFEFFLEGTRSRGGALPLVVVVQLGGVAL